jgi:hypothetical protein
VTASCFPHPPWHDAVWWDTRKFNWKLFLRGGDNTMLNSVLSRHLNYDSGVADRQFADDHVREGQKATIKC